MTQTLQQWQEQGDIRNFWAVDDCKGTFLLACFTVEAISMYDSGGPMACNIRLELLLVLLVLLLVMPAVRCVTETLTCPVSWALMRKYVETSMGEMTPLGTYTKEPSENTAEFSAAK